MTDIVKDFLKVMKHKSEVSNGDVGKVEVRKGGIIIHDTHIVIYRVFFLVC